jgi:hypothetical protein
MKSTSKAQIHTPHAPIGLHVNKYF